MMAVLDIMLNSNRRLLYVDPITVVPQSLSNLFTEQLPRNPPPGQMFSTILPSASAQRDLDQ
jgi:hypothetical protein